MTSIRKTPTSSENTLDADVRSASAFEMVCEAILDIAPDLDLKDLDRAAHLQGDLGLDSIDLVNIAGAIATHSGVDIPEAEYAALPRIGDIVDFVEARLAERE